MAFSGARVLGPQSLCCEETQATQRGHIQMFWLTVPTEVSADSHYQLPDSGVFEMIPTLSLSAYN